MQPGRRRGREACPAVIRCARGETKEWVESVAGEGMIADLDDASDTEVLDHAASVIEARESGLQATLPPVSLHTLAPSSAPCSSACSPPTKASTASPAADPGNVAMPTPWFP